MKRLLLTALFLIGALSSQAQFFQRSEFGLIGGGMNYMGDLNNKYNFKNTHLMLGVIYRYNFTPRWVLKANLSFGKVSANDADNGNIRNLNFESKINELGATCEFNFFDYQTGSARHRLTPYIFAGVSLLFMNPRTEITNPLTDEKEWVNLRDLSTEGEGIAGYDSKYSLMQIAVPFGLGVKFSLGKYVCIGLEWGLRKTFTDYIDDVSKDYVDQTVLINGAGLESAAAADRTHELAGYQNTYNKAGSMRGNPQTKDWYQTFGLTITTKIGFFEKKSCNTF